MIPMTERAILMRIEKSDHGFWVYPKEGRGKFIPFGSPTADRINAGLSLDTLDKRRRTEKNGCIEPVIYFRDEDGKIGVPPDPSMIPEGAVVLTATSLGELDKLSSEMQRELHASWKDNGFTAEMEEMMGLPRKQLVGEMANASPYGREVIRGLISALDKEESDRDRIQANTFFHRREYDR